MTKCIGIISYFPNNDKQRSVRKNRFLNLINVLNTYFKLPIVIIAQNWDKNDFILNYCNTITIYSYNHGLGITKARYILREKLLKLDYDYFIFLDDDSDIKCTQRGVDNYLKEIDMHEGMVGRFNNDLPRLLAISKQMLILMDYEFIKDKEASRGEIWEDFVYLSTYRRLYPDKFYMFSKKDIKEVSPVSRGDEFSTWYKKEFGNESQIGTKSRQIINKWVEYKRSYKRR